MNNQVEKEEQTNQVKKQKNLTKYLTVVLKYNDTNKKHSYDVTDFMFYIIESIKNYNENCSYDDYRFDLYGVCVDEDSEIAEQKNEYIRTING